MQHFRLVAEKTVWANQNHHFYFRSIYQILIADILLSSSIAIIKLIFLETNHQLKNMYYYLGEPLEIKITIYYLYTIFILINRTPWIADDKTMGGNAG